MKLAKQISSALHRSRGVSLIHLDGYWQSRRNKWAVVTPGLPAYSLNSLLQLFSKLPSWQLDECVSYQDAEL